MPVRKKKKEKNEMFNTTIHTLYTLLILSLTFFVFIFLCYCCWLFTFFFFFPLSFQCLSPTAPLYLNALGHYKFQSSLLNTISSGTPLGTLSVVGSGPATFVSSIGPSGYAYNTINGYLSLSTIPSSLGDFTFSITFLAQETTTTAGWRW
jgi:hypothetical protein